ncbi:MAG: AEC family transporter [Betaproteobacteria bacterium]|nr:AEC family transporter [Betaproteobacteria bacterium]
MSASPAPMSLIEYLHLLLEVMLPMALLVAAGAWWRRSLGEDGVRAVRGYISSITIHLFAPALLFAAAATARLDRELLSVPLLVGSGVLLSGALLVVLLRWLTRRAQLPRTSLAALMLCGMFGNVLFMGYPLLHYLYGTPGAQYAAFSDMGASTPLLWSLGVWVATHIGQQVRDPGHPLVNWLKLPPVWSFGAGLLLGQSGLPIDPLVHAARFIGQPTVPVMLLMLGLSVPWRRLAPTRWVGMIVGYKLLVLPALVWLMARALYGPLHQAQVGAVIESGVPTMLMALGLADRYRLDVETTALAIAWSTILFVFSLPWWLGWLH